MTINTILHKYWGYDTFRPLQEEIITSVMEGHDTLALLTTGGGKSVCYQIPALAMEGMCIVVSPLIALMKDQVEHLNQQKIKAACLVSGMNIKEQEIILNNCIVGKIKLLYVSPERLKQQLFIGHFSQMKINLIAVDEAHCISQWGYDFRPPYREIAKIRKYHPEAPVLALTATATPNVILDIKQQLQFRENSNTFQASFKRDNLAYMVFRENDKEGRLLRILNTVKGSCIVYVRNRRTTQKIANFLQSHGISAMFYHAGLEPKIRDAHQSEWMANHCQVMVATNAFGMGIDKADVRAVIHLDIPTSPEAYFQEAGRAGRDGKKSYAVLLYNDADVEQLSVKQNLAYPPLKQIQNIYRAIGNYYQLPIGSGAGCTFDLELDKICNNYNLDINECFSTILLLEREGLLSTPDHGEPESKINILISKEEIYRFQMENRKYGDLISIILRMYGGLFVDFIPINEKKIASKYPMADEKSIIRMLQHLDALKIISYQKKSNQPQITFLTERIDAKNLRLSETVYAQQKQMAQDRIDAMKNYIFADKGCRSQILLNYFGETNSTACNQCDLCITKNKKKSPNYTQVIKGILRNNPLDLKTLTLKVLTSTQNEEAKNFNETSIIQQIRELIDKGEIRQTSDFLLHDTHEK